MAERYNELMGKVQEYKEKKSRKEERKKKYELMEKTQKILWKKNSTNYSKWDYFTSSEEEPEEVEPILPKNDPSFQELERDLQDRKKRKQEDLKVAEDLKLKGNDYMKQGMYDHAVMKYTQALEIVKDVKALWLNRALAYIKLNKFRKAISDCTRVLEYAECFENGYTQSREACFKALLRRGTAYKNRKDYEKAMVDGEAALALCPLDKEAIQLRKDILILIEHQAKADELLKVERKESSESKDSKVTQDSDQKEKEIAKQRGEMDFREVIDSFNAKQTAELRNSDLLQVLKVMRKQPDEAKVYFYEKEGLRKVIEVIERSSESGNPDELTSHLPPLVIQIYIEGGVLFQEQFVTRMRGVDVVIRRVRSLMKQVKDKSSFYDEMQDYLEILDTMVDEEKIRLLLQKDETLSQALYPGIFAKVLSVFKTEPSFVNVFLSLCSNLCYGPSALKRCFENSHKEIAFLLSPIIETTPQKLKYLPLLTSLSNLLSNFLSEASFRQRLLADQECIQILFKNLAFQIQLLDLDNNPKWSKFCESALAVFVNMSYQATLQTQKYLYDMNLGETLLKKFIQTPHTHTTILARSLQILSKLNYDLEIKLITHHKLFHLLPALLPQPDYTNHALRLLIQLFQTNCNPPLLKLELQTYPLQLVELLTQLRALHMSDTELLFCNSCNATGMIIDLLQLQPLLPPNNVNPSAFFHQIIPRLLTLVRDKTGNIRKNAAILLAKLTKEEKNLQTLRDLHGIEILHSVYNHIIN